MIKLFLVRHGTTTAVEQRVLQGSTDSPLSERGREEACRAASAFQNSTIEYAFASPIGRAKETADIICGRLGIEYQILEDLREMDFGFYEGRDYFDAPDEHTSIIVRFGLLGRILIAQVTGEPLFHVSRRARQAWHSITKIAQDRKVLVITHGALINYLIRYLLPLEAYKKIRPVQSAPCSITELDVAKPGHAVLLRLNDVRHLQRSAKTD
ncbi:MAG: histidine phosphatase family protein [Chloroflexi bacterium]|nr:histidine phosphatase family protein [Chloroflexota bacterium]